MPTGEVELQVDELEIVSRSTPLPFQLDEEGVDETLRLRYRWLDLRRAKLQRNLRLRAQMVGIIRREMQEAGFLDIQTPILFKPTPEGARDFVVPSRLHNGRFFALPQSPQILKQLTMVAGFDRYYQIAICFRDEDLRADRVQEITQLDVEMSFPDRELLFALMERTFAAIWRECIGVEIETPFPRMSYAEADRRFGSDKPDTRFGLEVEDATEVTRGSRVRRLRGRGGCAVPARAAHLSRVPTSPRSRTWPRSEGRRASPISCVTRRPESSARRSPSSSPSRSSRRSGSSRARRSSSAPTTGRRPRRCSGISAFGSDASSTSSTRRRSRSCGSTRFPMFEWDEDEGRWNAVHHPFTRPTDEWRDRFDERAGRGARGRLRPHRERQRARRRLVPDPRARAPGAGVRLARRSAPTSNVRSSGSCSTRSRWARRRTAGSRSASTGR